MKVLQDRCTPSLLQDIESLFLKDLKVKMSDLFASFDLKPIGVASLAQVHRATLKDGRQVAVKIQHPSLDNFTPLDIAVCCQLVEFVKKAFPDFEFDWLAAEMRESLPRELNFIHEAENARKVAENFKRNAVLKIPKVFWADRRVLCMECKYYNSKTFGTNMAVIEGGKIDNLDYMNKYGINVRSISYELTKAYSEMIFLHGSVLSLIFEGT